MKIALVGNQNSGKTTLFNVLTGMNAKIGNWPGVTIERKTGIIKGTTYEITDLPGIYSLSPYSIEEEVSRKFIFEENPDVIINIVDSTSLERSLYLTTQLLELDSKVIVALNMVDILEKKGLAINEQKLEQILGTKVIKISALKEIGIDELIKEITIPKSYNKLYIYDAIMEKTIQQVENLIHSEINNKRFIAVKLLEEDNRFEELNTSKIKNIQQDLANNYNTDLEEIVATERYEFIEQAKKETVSYLNSNFNITEEKYLVEKTSKETISDKLDKIFLNKWLAFPIFIAIMFLIYYLSVGVIGRFTVDWISDFVDTFGEKVRTGLEIIGTSRWINSLVVDGIIAGVGAVLGFVPQLIILFTCISILETTGYMSRIALLLDKVFRMIGLSGKSLIPFIVGAGCSVPGIMGTRIIENQDEREMTTILTPFVPCSAKLPIIALFSGYFFEEKSGLISVSLYFFAIATIIVSAILMKKFVFKNTSSTYISELPEYKLPNIKYVTKDVLDKTLSFIKRAGSTILICSIVIWFLLSFSLKFEYGVNIENSILARLGKTISWIFYPMIGTNSWGATVSAIQGLVAKEQVISSMTVIAGLAEDTVEESQIFKSGIFDFFTASSAYAFMVFNLFSAPCFGAIGAMKRELGGNKKILKVVTFQIVFAWCLATIVYQIGTIIENGIHNFFNIIVLSIIGLIVFIILKRKKLGNSECKGCPYCKDYEKREKTLKNFVD